MRVVATRVARPRLGHGRRALSMIELMISMTIFSWVIMALFSVWVAHARALTKSQDNMVAAALCEQVMEAQLSLGWTADNVTETPFTVTHIVEGTPSKREYFYKVDVEIADIISAKSMKHVKVTVRYVDSLEIERTVIMNTYLSWQG